MRAVMEVVWRGHRVGGGAVMDKLEGVDIEL
jgi:hypothetical protein